jgi:uncharacterized protein
MRRFLVATFVLLLISGGALAALHFPALTGRVVDQAHLLSPSTEQSLEQQLADFETQTTDQIVVVTINSLEGTSIEDYGYQLGRAWGIGQKDKNNGVLLIVAPKERKVRIEVGYGLEGTLTDAASEQIIQNVILPDFRVGHMEQGVIDGTSAILNTLGGSPAPELPQPTETFFTSQNAGNLVYVMVLLLYLFIRLLIITNLPFMRRHPSLAWLAIMSSTSSGSSSSGFGGGGGFSGGGGSFGGGGASGGW